MFRHKQILFGLDLIQRKDRKDVIHLVSPFRSGLSNEMQEMIVFLKLFFNGPSLKEVSVILKNACVKTIFSVCDENFG